MILVYVGAATLMLRPKTGCITDKAFAGQCFKPAEKRTDPNVPNGKQDDQPLIEWDVAIVFSFVQM